ncbi:ATP-binding protein [Kitasatospora sp. NPDC057198]|uniref:ATP-binding protein n=1 Tax=Kitasatospora sp. NPDC057198 TaxID=3346046 RepID=UPI003632BCCB
MLPRSTGDEVEGLSWEDFLTYWQHEWKPGQHCALIGPTGMGKSTFALGAMAHRKYVLALDPKGGDSTLATTGWPRLLEWPPPRQVYEQIAEGRPARFIVGGKTRTLADRALLEQLLREVMNGVFESRGWTVYADEFQLLADRKMMNLGAQAELLLIAARDKGISFVTSYQAPAWVPTAASRQATWVVVWPTRDVNVVKALAEIIGRDWRMVQEAVRALPPYHVLVANRNPHDPLIITKAPAR